MDGSGCVGTMVVVVVVAVVLVPRTTGRSYKYIKDKYISSL